QLLWHAIAQSSGIKRVWGSAEARLDTVRRFAALALGARPDGEAHLALIREKLSSFSHSVNMLSVYPHTLLMLYYLSQRQFELTIPGWKTIGTDYLVKALFNKEIPILLQYTESLADSANHYQLLYAFDFIIRS